MSELQNFVDIHFLPVPVGDTVTLTSAEFEELCQFPEIQNWMDFEPSTAKWDRVMAFGRKVKVQND